MGPRRTEVPSDEDHIQESHDSVTLNNHESNVSAAADDIAVLFIVSVMLTELRIISRNMDETRQFLPDNQDDHEEMVDVDDDADYDSSTDDSLVSDNGEEEVPSDHSADVSAKQAIGQESARNMNENINLAISILAEFSMEVCVVKDELHKERGAVTEEYRGTRNAIGRMQDANYILIMEVLAKNKHEKQLEYQTWWLHLEIKNAVPEKKQLWLGGLTFDEP
ncbi:hypothetical protein PanWU01x14_360790 [Parasponia andersonii]|uniref:Uncharacterized protein n=1 Tax=Parasponia andersonii TaxID=3476 RepID=A0A2P5A7H4_PARAD|nr:hypothetical protein PanWU01x14_360790 [Parasponia andersonii]